MEIERRGAHVNALHLTTTWNRFKMKQNIVADIILEEIREDSTVARSILVKSHWK